MRTAAAVGFLVVVVALAAGALWFALRPADAPTREELAQAAVTVYLEAWQRRDWTELAELTADGTGVAEAHRASWEGLEVVDATFDADLVQVDRGRATNDVSVQVELPSGASWSYDVQLVLERDRGDWRVRWTPATVHPALDEGEHLARRVTEPTLRAAILAHDGTPIASSGDVLEIGIHPARITSEDLVVDAFAAHSPVDADDVRRVLDRVTNPAWFYPVVTVDAGEEDRVRRLLLSVPGIVIKRGGGRVNPTPVFAQHVLGRVGERTAEELAALGPDADPNERVGRYGLEQVFEEQLVGTPVTEVVVVDGSGEVAETVDRVGGLDPEPVTTTLDVEVQNAVDAALADVTQPAAIVVVDVDDSAIRGVASRPLGGFDRALTGLYPPGSTFKTVTAAALLRTRRPDEPVDCPVEAIVGGLRIRNADAVEAGPTDLAGAFARSCNTSFALMAADLEEGELAEAAATFGFDRTYELAVPVAGARFPEPADLAERAAAAFGQGRVQASPVHLATVAASVASGAWHAPRLLEDDPAAEGTALDARVVEPLDTMLRQAVTSGTATAADVPGREVRGKTGSAEHAGPSTHAWFIGYADGLAIAVLVEEGGSGTDVAAPLAARVLEAAGSG